MSVVWALASAGAQLRYARPNAGETGRMIEGEFGPEWQAFAEALPTIVFTARPNGSIEYVNQRWFELTGLAGASVLDDAWSAIIHPEDLERTGTAWAAAMRSGEPAHIETRVRCADGEYRWVLSIAEPMRASDGNIGRWFGNVIEIQSRKHAEASLHARDIELLDTEQRFRVLAEAIPVIVWTADASGWIDWYNHRWYEYTGQTPEEAAGWGWQAAHHPEDFLAVMTQWPHSIATGAPFEMEFRLRGRDGHFHWFLTRCVPLLNAQGEVVRWYGSNVDIDAQKQALDRTMRVAQTLQEVFLPKHLPQRPGVRMDALYLPAEKDALVGGDWYDVFDLPDGRLAFSIGDVAGHGLDASITVGRLRQAIYTLAAKSDDPADILTDIDALLRRQEPGTFVTALVGFIDNGCTTMRYASAGHPPPLIAYTNQSPASMLAFGEPPLGVDFIGEFTTHTVPLAPDAVLALYTDGITEFSGDVLAAEAKLGAAVSLLVGDTSVARPAKAVQEIVFNGMQARDDAALLIIQFSAVASFEAFDPNMLEKTWRFHSSSAYTARASRLELVAYLRQMTEDPDLLFTSELVIGEILANTVEHAPGLVEIKIDCSGEHPVLVVRDTGPGMRELAGELPVDEMDEDGRGLFLIKALAQEASVKLSRGYGTELRAVLPIRCKRPRANPEVEALKPKPEENLRPDSRVGTTCRNAEAT